MNSDEALVAAIDALSACKVPYMLVGSISSNFYGYPRSTRDADFVIQVDDNTISTLMRHLPAEMSIDPQMSFESVTATTRHVIRITNSSFRIEFFILSDDGHDQERFRRRVTKELLGRKVLIPTAEDVVITKLRWATRARRRKDLDDVQNVIAAQGEKMDWDYIHKWCGEHGTMELLRELRDSIPPM